MKKPSFLLFGFMLFIAGCTMPEDNRNWGQDWSEGNPSEIPMEMTADPKNAYGMAPVSSEPENQKIKTVSVLLPLSGPSGSLGTGIQHAIEIAFFQKNPQNIMVSFHDFSGSDSDKERTLDSVISSSPDIIIGPLFADDVDMLQKKKPQNIPAITFTSAKQVLGNGVFTLALLPNQAVESIVKQIKSEGKQKVLIIAPDTSTGYMLGNNAIESAKIYGIDVAGFYFYDEGDSKDMEELSAKVSLFESRVNNLTRAKGILSDVLIKEQMTPAEKDNIRLQLEGLNKLDSLGKVPYDSILLLGNAEDSKTLAAYLRFYDVRNDTVDFYGSALWDTDIVYRDSSLAGGEYAGLPRISDAFLKLYSEIEGAKPNRFNSIGYDAAMLAIKSLSGNNPASSLLDPSGYYGLDGLVRLRPNGENERALQIMKLNGIRLPMIQKRAVENFVKPIYQTTKYELTKPDTKKLTSEGYNPMDFITLPSWLQSKYIGETYDIIYDDTVEQVAPDAEHVEVIPEDTDSAIIDKEFTPTKLDSVDKKLINEVKMKM